MSGNLQSLLSGAVESPPARRDWWADGIAAHGVDAIEALAAWLPDPALHDFALKTILLAAERGGQLALGAAKSVLDAFDTRHLGRDSLAVFWRAQGRIEGLARTRPVPHVAAQVTSLISGRLYKRRQLHASGLGGNVQKGISYPAKGNHLLLFSGGTGRDVYGYEDNLVDNEFEYYGEWSGGGDMTMAAGNAAIIDRSPQLYVFIGQGNGVCRFEGRYEYESHRFVPARRAGKEAHAIVFRLRKVADRVDL